MIVHGYKRGRYLLSQDWFKISGHYITDDKQIQEDYTRENTHKVLNYVFKYILKGFNFKDQHDKEDFKHVMYHKRLVMTYGEWYNFHYETAKHVSYPCPLCTSKDGFVFFEYVDNMINWETYAFSESSTR